MKDFKSWLQSRTIWSILVAVSPIVSKYLGFDLGTTLEDIIVIIGAVSAIIFRVKAEKKLS